MHGKITGSRHFRARRQAGSREHTNSYREPWQYSLLQKKNWDGGCFKALIGARINGFTRRYDTGLTSGHHRVWCIFPKPVPEGEPRRPWLKRVYNIQRWPVFPNGGHFAPIEERAALAAGLSVFFRELRRNSPVCNQDTESGLKKWPIATAALGNAYGKAGHRAKAECIMRERYVIAYGMAVLAAGSRNATRRLHSLSRASAKRRIGWSG